MSPLQLPPPSSSASPPSSGLSGGFTESQPGTEVKSWSVHNPVGDLDGLISLKLCDMSQGGRGQAISTSPGLTLQSDVALVT